MSVYAIGLTDETPISFATAMPRIKFNWMSSNDEVITLSSVYANVRKIQIIADLGLNL